jgi:hypothetical protein
MKEHQPDPVHSSNVRRRRHVTATDCQDRSWRGAVLRLRVVGLHELGRDVPPREVRGPLLSAIEAREDRLGVVEVEDLVGLDALDSSAPSNPRLTAGLCMATRDGMDEARPRHSTVKELGEPATCT